jgi:hypothetical protein
MKYELHCHSCYSKGSKIPAEGIPRPEEIIREAKRIGLSGVAITDHKTTACWKAAAKEAKKQGILFIPAVELQTKAGHMIALGINEAVENFLGAEESVEKIHAAAGIAIAPHPFDIRGEGLGRLAFLADAVEIFNSLSIDKISNRFMLSRFKRSSMPRVVGSDAHTLAMLGSAVNIMDADDIDGVLKSIRKGNVLFRTRYIQMDEIIEWARQRLVRSKAEVIEYTDAQYAFPKRWLYKKMLKKFLATSDMPWKILAEISLQVVRLYGTTKIVSY